MPDTRSIPNPAPMSPPSSPNRQMEGSDRTDEAEWWDSSSPATARLPPGLSPVVDGSFFPLRNLGKGRPKHISSQGCYLWWCDMGKVWRVALTHSARTFGTRRALRLNRPPARRLEWRTFIYYYLSVPNLPNPSFRRPDDPRSSQLTQIALPILLYRTLTCNPAGSTPVPLGPFTNTSQTGWYRG